MAKVEPKDVPCPTCNAPKNSPCLTATKISMGPVYHGGRRRRAIKRAIFLTDSTLSIPRMP